MPAKGSIGKFHGRYPLISVKLWKKYVKDSGSDVSYEDFKNILAESMSEIRKWVLKEPIGFQMPGLGNVAVNRFKPKKDFKTFINTTKGPVKNHNLHTGGDAFHLRWYHSSSSYSKRMPYWFLKASRAFNRELAVVLKRGNSPNFNSFTQDHFVTKELRKCKY